jgi:putative flippase GtrA
MHLLATVLLADTKVSIIFPSYVFGIIAGCIFLFFGVVTWTYRDVANRHASRAATQYHDDHEHGTAGPHH